MPSLAAQTNEGAGDGGFLGSSGLFHLVRQAHIFSAVVHEILELKILDEVTTDPLSLNQFHLLKLISIGGEHQVGQVAGFLGVSPPAASKSIDKLERLDLVTRRDSPADRRVTVLVASTKGKRLVARYEREKKRRLAPVLQALNSRELSQLSELLEKFSSALIEKEESGEGWCFRCSAYFDEFCPVLHCPDECPYQRARLSTRRPA